MFSIKFLRYFTFIGLILVMITEVKGKFVVNKYYLDKQKFLLEIFHRIEEPTLNKVWLNLGMELQQEKTLYFEYNEYMEKFYEKFQRGELLPKDVSISPLFYTNSIDFLGLYNFLCNSRSWETFSSNVCWARNHVNPSLFVFTVTLTLLTRYDFKGLMLPKMHEIMPQHFFSQPYILQAEAFDFANWNKWQQYETPFDGKTYKKMHASPWQWWHLLGIKQQIQKSTEKHILPLSVEDGLRNSSSWTLAMADIHVIWQPVDYSRNFAIEQGRQKMSYFIEDVDWNAYWYNFNMDIIAASFEKDVNSHKLVSCWFWNLQQLLMRYKLELYGNGLESIEHEKKVSEPFLQTWNGKRYKPLMHRQESQIMKGIQYIRDEVLRATTAETFSLKSGARLDLKNSAQLEDYVSIVFKTNLIRIFRGYYDPAKPQLLHNLETMLREPNFYYYANQLVREYSKLRAHFQSCDQGSLQIEGLNITNARISSLVTYMEIADYDISNLLNNKHFYYAGHFLWQKTLQARQQRLNHKDFIIRLNVTATKSQKVVIRTFVLPNQAWRDDIHFYQLDSFVANLDPGLNNIERRSKEFSTNDGTIGHSELYRLTYLALYEKLNFPLGLTRPHCGFPRRLLLPRGSFEGLPVKIFYIITPYAGQSMEPHCDLYENFGSIADFTYSCDLLGIMASKMPNFYAIDTRIYHEDKLNKIL